MSDNIARLKLAYNNDGETHLDVDFGYDIGGDNWLSGGTRTRGYYLFCTPVRRENRDGVIMVRNALGKGLKILLKEVDRKSKKAEAEAREMANAEIRRLVTLVLQKYGLKLEKKRKTVALYQINAEKDVNRIRFEGLDELAALKVEFDPTIYEKVFEGEVDADTLDDIFTYFNSDDRPGRKRFHSMSVSDVVELKEESESKFFFCDTVGFTEVAFDPAYTTDASPERINILYMEPGKEARMVSVEATLEEYQRICDTDCIQAIYPFEDPSVVLVCDNEGKLKNAVKNRALYDEDGVIQDVLCGPFFICRQDEDGEWVSLTPEQQEKYLAMYKKPKRFERWVDEYKEFDI